MDQAIASKPRWRRSRTALTGLSHTAAVMVVLLAWGCDKDLSRDYELIVRVSSEPGRALEGAGATLQGRDLGVSDSSGADAIKVRGQEGDVLPILVSCPAGHRPPPPLLVPLRRVGGHVRPEFAAVCAPMSHSVIVAVRAERGPNLPLFYLGREMARTDSSGAAHLVLDVASEDVLELVLDTTEQPRLRPRSPSLRIQPGPSDEITAVNQEFTLLQEEPVKKVATRRGPVRIR